MDKHVTVKLYAMGEMLLSCRFLLPERLVEKILKDPERKVVVDDIDVYVPKK
jgi:hypothetical protein